MVETVKILFQLVLCCLPSFFSKLHFQFCFLVTSSLTSPEDVGRRLIDKLLSSRIEKQKRRLEKHNEIIQLLSFLTARFSTALLFLFPVLTTCSYYRMKPHLCDQPMNLTRRACCQLVLFLNDTERVCRNYKYYQTNSLCRWLRIEEFSDFFIFLFTEAFQTF